MGYSIPWCDREEVAEKCGATMLTLFKPWNRDMTCPLKSNNCSWSEEFLSFSANIPPQCIKTMQHMQDTYECRDAAHNYSANCKMRLAELNLLGKGNGYDPVLEDIDNDLLWEFAIQNTVNNNDVSDDIDTGTFGTTSKGKSKKS